MVKRKPQRAIERTAHLEPALVNLGPRRPPIAQRPPDSATLRAFVSAEAKKTTDPPEPRIGCGSARHQQSFELLEPEAGVTRPLVELDPTHAPDDPWVGFRHGPLQGADAPSAARGSATDSLQIPEDV
jgi:hypothetical protein